MDRTAPKGLLITMIFVGILMFFLPTINKFVNWYNHKEYINTTAQFVSTFEGGTWDNGTQMYFLVYRYVVNGQEHYYQTDFSTSSIPKIGSEIKISYNPINHDDSYSNSFPTFTFFRILGLFFIFIPLIMLFSDMRWLMDILIGLFTGILSVLLIIYKGYYGAGIFALIVLGILFFASIMDFITLIKNNEFKPLQDLKEEKIKSQKIKLEKEMLKKNLTQEEINIKIKKRKRIIKGILLFLAVPLFIFIDVTFGIENKIIYWMLVLISTICTFVGFFVTGMTFGGVDLDNLVITIAGKVIDNEKLKNIKQLNLKEKIEVLNIKGVILRIFAVFGSVGIIFLIIEDPFNFYDSVENIGRVQTFCLLGFVFFALFILLYKNNRKRLKKGKTLWLIIMVVSFIIAYFATIPPDNNKKVLSSNEFIEKFAYEDYSVKKVNKIEKIHIENSEVFLAEKENTKIFYIISENFRTTRKIYESIKEDDFSDCTYNGTGGVNGNYKYSRCENPNYARGTSKLKNTIIYFETTIENEENIKNKIISLGYIN